MKSGSGLPRGRPRGFDCEAAVALAQRLFQERGYDGVGIAALTEALGINPPSFYAAFGSKAALFERVLDRYQQERLPAERYLRPGLPPAEALRTYLEAAARVYAADAATAGCLILETARGTSDPACAMAARQRKKATREAIAAFVRETHPADADALADFVLTTSTGLSAAAREGAGAACLLTSADIAARAIADRLRG